MTDSDKTIPLFDTNISNELIDDPEKYVFWCGAGVSAEAPTKLPLGNQFTRYVLSELVDEVFQKELENKLQDIDSSLKAHNIEIGNCLRLESVISEVSLIENNLKPKFADDLKFISSLATFYDSPFNIYHYYLAKLVVLGSNVVTTNYDFGIEKAVDLLCPGEYVIQKLTDGQYVYCSKDERKGKIYHIHGIALKPKEVGITYKTVSRSFHPSILAVLDTWMKNDFTIAFLGYSCGDNYDVERYFERFKQTSKARAVYVQRKAKDLTKSVKRHLNCFSKSFVFSNGISAFFKSVFIVFNDDGFQIDGKNSFDWEEKIGEQIHISEEMRGLLFFRICKLAGINPCEFSYFNRAMVSLSNMMKQSHVEDYLIRLTYFHVVKENADFDSCMKIINEGDDEYNRKYNSTYFYPDRRRYDLNEVLVVKRDYEELFKCLPDIVSINKGIHKYQAEHKTIGWEFSTPLHQHMKIIVYEAKKHISDSGKYELPVDLRNRANELLICNSLLLDSELGNFEEINQYCVALRAKALLMSFLYGKEEISTIDACVNEYMDLYSKESSVQGVLMSLYDYSTIQFCLYTQTNNDNYRSISDKVLDDVIAIQNIIKNVRLSDEISSEQTWRETYDSNR